jgi:hypothetical protein
VAAHDGIVVQHTVDAVRAVHRDGLAVAVVHNEDPALAHAGQPPLGVA